MDHVSPSPTHVATTSVTLCHASFSKCSPYRLHILFTSFHQEHLVLLLVPRMYASGDLCPGQFSFLSGLIYFQTQVSSRLVNLTDQAAQPGSLMDGPLKFSMTTLNAAPASPLLLGLFSSVRVRSPHSCPSWRPSSPLDIQAVMLPVNPTFFFSFESVLFLLFQAVPLSCLVTQEHHNSSCVLQC